MYPAYWWSELLAMMSWRHATDLEGSPKSPVASTCKIPCSTASLPGAAFLLLGVSDIGPLTLLVRV